MKAGAIPFLPALRVFIKRFLSLFTGLSLLLGCNTEQSTHQESRSAPDGLPSWKDEAVKQRIITFMRNSTDTTSGKFIPQTDRVSVFDNVGKRQVMAVGNSDGDYEMLRYKTSSPGYDRLGIVIHHTDEVREFAYDSLSHVGRLKRALTDAVQNNWLIVDMKKDWTTVFATSIR